MNEKLNEALEQIPDEYINEAVSYKNRRLPRYFGAIAAVLVLVLLLAALNPFGGSSADSSTAPSQPDFSGRFLIAAPDYPKMAPFREWGKEGYEEWKAGLEAQYNQPEGYGDSLDHFFKESIPEFLAAAKAENAVCSPISIYMALSMLAECTAGNSQKQILDLLGAESIEALRQQAGHVWNAHYRDDGRAKLLMANSLWLDDFYSFRRETVDILASSYYASVFHGDLGTEASNEALQGWINAQTGDLLGEQVKSVKFDPLTVLALASTIEYRVDWNRCFQTEANTQAVFHGSSGDSTAIYMHQSLDDNYYTGSDFTAAALPLQDGSKMWLILPDAGITPGQLLAAGTALDMALGNPEAAEETYALINLSVPRFDINSQADLIPAVKNLGVTDIFSSLTADFSSIVIEENDEYALFVSTIDHSARVCIDEKGVIGAAYTLIMVEDECAPNKVVDFVLDRPFLFVVTSPDGLPLFTGVVNGV